MERKAIHWDPLRRSSGGIGWSITWILRLQALRQNFSYGRGCHTRVEEAEGGSLVFAGSLQKDLEIPRATKFLHADHGPCNLRIPKTPDIQRKDFHNMVHDSFRCRYSPYRSRHGSEVTIGFLCRTDGSSGDNDWSVGDDSLRFRPHGCSEYALGYFGFDPDWKPRAVSANKFVIGTRLTWFRFVSRFELTSLFTDFNFAGRHSSQWVGTPWFVLLLFVGVDWETRLPLSLLPRETAPSDPLCFRHGIWLLRESILGCTAFHVLPEFFNLDISRLVSRKQETSKIEYSHYIYDKYMIESCLAYRMAWPWSLVGKCVCRPGCKKRRTQAAGGQLRMMLSMQVATSLHNFSRPSPSRINCHSFQRPWNETWMDHNMFCQFWAQSTRLRLCTCQRFRFPTNTGMGGFLRCQRLSIECSWCSVADEDLTMKANQDWQQTSFARVLRSCLRHRTRISKLQHVLFLLGIRHSVSTKECYFSGTAKMQAILIRK